MEVSKKKKIYLAHALPSRHRIREWELKFEKEFPNIELYNPFYDRDKVGGRKDIERLDRGLEIEKPKDWAYELVREDLHMISESRGTLAILDENMRIGTIMEIVYSSRVFNHPVYCVVENEHYDHPWIQYHCTYRFKSLKEFEQWAKKNL